MFVKLSTNLKGLGEVALSRHMIIAAPCGGRKSAVLEAITLALAGGVYDLEGRPWVKDPGTLCESLGDSTGHLWVQLWRDDGACYKWSATNGRGVEHNKPEDWERDVVPLAALDTAISGSDAKAYQNLLSMFNVSFPLEDLSALLEDQYAAYRALLGHRDDDDDAREENPSAEQDDFSFDEEDVKPRAPVDPNRVTVDVLLHARDLAKGRTAALQREIRAYDQSSRAILGEKPLPSDLTTARTRLSEAESQLAAAPRRSQNAVALEEARRTLEGVILHGKEKVQHLGTVRTRIQELEAKLPDLQDAVKQASSASPDALQRYAAQSRVYRYLHQQVQGKVDAVCGCPTCGEQVDRRKLAGRLARIVEISQEKEAEVKRIAATGPDPGKALREAEARLAQLRAESAKLDQEVQALRDQHQRVKAQIALGESDAQRFDPKQLQQLERARDAAKAELDAVNQRDAAWKSRMALEAQAKNAREQKARIDGLIGKLDGAVDTLVRRQLAQVVSQVQQYMPEGWDIAVQDDPFRVGLLHADRRLAASGAQRNAILLAICAAAYTDAVLIPPERSYDDESLTRIAKGLSSSSCQVFLTTTSATALDIPGWTTFEPNGGGKTQAKPEKVPGKRGRKPRVKDDAPGKDTSTAASAQDDDIVRNIAQDMAVALQAQMADFFAETTETVLPS